MNFYQSQQPQGGRRPIQAQATSRIVTSLSAQMYAQAQAQGTTPPSAGQIHYSHPATGLTISRVDGRIPAPVTTAQTYARPQHPPAPQISRGPGHASTVQTYYTRPKPAPAPQISRGPGHASTAQIHYVRPQPAPAPQISRGPGPSPASMAQTYMRPQPAPAPQISRGPGPAPTAQTYMRPQPAPAPQISRVPSPASTAQISVEPIRIYVPARTPRTVEEITLSSDSESEDAEMIGSRAARQSSSPLESQTVPTDEFSSQLTLKEPKIEGSSNSSHSQIPLSKGPATTTTATTSVPVPESSTSPAVENSNQRKSATGLLQQVRHGWQRQPSSSTSASLSPPQSVTSMEEDFTEQCKRVLEMEESERQMRTQLEEKDSTIDYAAEEIKRLKDELKACQSKLSERDQQEQQRIEKEKQQEEEEKTKPETVIENPPQNIQGTREEILQVWNEIAKILANIEVDMDTEQAGNATATSVGVGVVGGGELSEQFSRVQETVSSQQQKWGAELEEVEEVNEVIKNDILNTNAMLKEMARLVQDMNWVMPESPPTTPNPHE